jgi:hypothetical protein
VIEGRVIGLTHYTDHVTMEELGEINAIAERLTGEADEPFYFIIDNRNINMDGFLSLEQLQGAAPFMNHALLRGVVTVLPRRMAVDASTLPIERNRNVHLKLVNTVDEAFEHLAEEGLAIDDESRGFFPD